MFFFPIRTNECFTNSKANFCHWQKQIVIFCANNREETLRRLFSSENSCWSKSRHKDTCGSVERLRDTCHQKCVSFTWNTETQWQERKLECLRVVLHLEQARDRQREREIRLAKKDQQTDRQTDRQKQRKKEHMYTQTDPTERETARQTKKNRDTERQTKRQTNTNGQKETEVQRSK